MIYVFLISFLVALWLPAATEGGYIGSWGIWVSVCIMIFWAIIVKAAEILDKRMSASESTENGQKVSYKVTNKKMSASAPTENRQIYEKTHKKIVA